MGGAGLQERVAQLEARVAQVRGEHEQALTHLQEQRQRLKECDAAAQTLRRQQAALQSRLSDCSVERKKAGHRRASPIGCSSVPGRILRCRRGVGGQAAPCGAAWEGHHHQHGVCEGEVTCCLSQADAHGQGWQGHPRRARGP